MNYQGNLPLPIDDLACFAAHLLFDGLNGGDEVGPKPDRIVVTLVKGEPRRAMTTLGKSARIQDRFSKSRRSRDPR